MASLAKDCMLWVLQADLWQNYLLSDVWYALYDKHSWVRHWLFLSMLFSWAWFCHASSWASFSCECIHIQGKKTSDRGNGRYGRVSISALFHCQTWGKDGCATLFLGRKFGVFTTLETNICRIHQVCKIFLLYLYSSLGGGFICNCLISIYKDTNNISLPQLLSIISYTELTLI